MSNDPTSTPPYGEVEVAQAVALVKEQAERGHRVVIVTRTDDVYPWWQTFRWPFRLLAACMVGLTVAVVSLSVALFTKDRADAVETSREACRDLYNNRVGEAAGDTRTSSGRVDNAIARAVLELYREGELVLTNPDELDGNITDNENRLVTDEATIDARDAWVAAGSPLPCPIAPGDDLPSPTTSPSTITDRGPSATEPSQGG